MFRKTAEILFYIRKTEDVFFFTYFESLNHEKIQHESRLCCFFYQTRWVETRRVVGLKRNYTKSSTKQERLPGGDGLLLGFFRLWT